MTEHKLKINDSKCKIKNTAKRQDKTEKGKSTFECVYFYRTRSNLTNAKENYLLHKTQQRKRRLIQRIDSRVFPHAAVDLIRSSVAHPELVHVSGNGEEVVASGDDVVHCIRGCSIVSGV